MENQDIKWETWEEQPQENNAQQQDWGEQPQQEQPQVNWGEESPQENIPIWDEQSQEEQPQINWGEQPQEESIPTWDKQENEQPQQESEQGDWSSESSFQNDDSIQSWNMSSNEPEEVIEEVEGDFTDIVVEEWETKTSILGLLPKLKIESLLYQFHYNNKLAVEEITTDGFNPIDNDSRYKINYQPNTELANILGAIKSIGESRGMKLQHSYLYKNEPKESTINIARGECIYNYIYFLQGDYQSGDVVLDFSSLNGPSEQVIQTTPGILLLLPGWVPYSITKNKSNKDMIAVAGRFIHS